MLANKNYQKLPKHFWAHVKAISESMGYSDRSTGKLRRFDLASITEGLKKYNLSTKHLNDPLLEKAYHEQIVNYLNYRADLLENEVEPNLMKREEASETFNRLLKKLKPKCKLPMNKQKGKKKHNAYLTCIVNMLTEKELGGCYFDEDPQRLTVVSVNDVPVRTFTRRFDGAYPKAINPIALWELKEYYGTTTFGSRVADGIYESILDGLEIQELKNSEEIHINHYLIVDDHFTWWVKGRSYLCRIIDMLHMSYLDEALFGKEVLERWPLIVRGWKKVKPTR